MTITDEQINAELADLIDELAAWKDKGFQRHSSALHTPENAAADKGGSMKYCPGDRAIFVSDRIAKIVRTLDDVQPQPRFKGLSKRDDVVGAILERRVAEKDAPAPVDDVGPVSPPVITPARGGHP